MTKGKIIRRRNNVLDLPSGYFSGKQLISPRGRLNSAGSPDAPTGWTAYSTPKDVSGIDSTAGNVANIIGSTTSMISSSVGNAQTLDNSADISDIERVSGYNPIYTDNESLMNGYTNFQYADAGHSKGDYMKGSGDYLKGTLSAAASGASAGAALGTIVPGIGNIVGAAGGAIVGTIGGLLGWGKSASDAAKKASSTNRQALEANKTVMPKFMNNRNNISLDTINDYLRTYAAYGGPLSTNGADFDNGLIAVDAGGTHESSPLDGVPMGVAPDGVPNLVEEGELVFNNYVFSNRLSPSKKVLEVLHLPKKYENHTYAYIAERLGKESEERPNDPISKRGLQDSMMRLMTAQESTRQSMKKNKGHKFAEGGWAEYLRYAPVVESGITTITDALGLTNKPDYTNAERIEKAAGNIREVSAPKIGDYLSYTPFDREYFSNQLGAQSSATRRGAKNLAGLNRGTAISSLIAADYNNTIGLGNLYRQGLEYNQAQKEKVATFNRGTNQANAELGIKADTANQSSDVERAKYLTTAANLRESILGTTSRNKSSNRDTLAMNLGSVGKEEYIKKIIENNPALLYDYLGRYKGAVTAACGGTLRTKKKRR